LDELVMQRGQHVQDDEADEQRREPEVRLKGRIAEKLLGSGAPEPANTISGSPAASPVAKPVPAIRTTRT